MFIGSFTWMLSTDLEPGISLFCTANVLHTIPPALQEPHGSDPAIGLHGGSKSWKSPRNSWVPKQDEGITGLAGEVEFQDDGLKELITLLTAVKPEFRNLEREIGNVLPQDSAAGGGPTRPRWKADKGELAKAVIRQPKR